LPQQESSARLSSVSHADITDARQEDVPRPARPRAVPAPADPADAKVTAAAGSANAQATAAAGPANAQATAAAGAADAQATAAAGPANARAAAAVGPAGGPGPTQPPGPVAADGRPASRAGHQKPEPRVERPPGTAADRAGARMTARGAVVAMLSLFFVGMLAAGWLHLGSLIGLSFVAGCVLAARYTKRDGLLTAVVTPPLIFMIALAGTQTMSAHADTLRRTLTSAIEGIVLTLASVAPWLFGGVILGLVVAVFGGLPRCVSEFRADLRAGADPRRKAPIR